jgi:DNA adenine methylase
MEEMMMYNKSPLKWAGSKNKALSNILPIINSFEFDVFVEPFVGAANVSLNVEAESYLWADSNEDLINTYNSIFYDTDNYVELCQEYFKRFGFEGYYSARDLFNGSGFDTSRAALFQYLNKHGFNGLCRYNQKGELNVPRGNVTKSPKKVPVAQIETLCERHKHNTDLRVDSYDRLIPSVSMESYKALIYCDSPYVPLTSDFKYTKDAFTLEDHKKLKDLALQSKHTTLISNHWTEFTQELYSDADDIHVFDVQRTISCKGSERRKVQECLVVYK